MESVMSQTHQSYKLREID